MRKWLILALLSAAGPVWAEPGLSTKVYGSVVDQGKFELEARYGGLLGGPGDGEAKLVTETSYGVSDTWYLAGLVEFEKEPGDDWIAEAVAIESILELTGGPKDAWRTALYGELELSLHGEGGKVEIKGLAEYRDGPWNARFNLILERAFGHDAFDEIEAGYAVRVIRQIQPDFDIGVEVFGDFGTLNHLTTDAPHYIGPIVATELHFEGSELELQVGYLFGYGDSEGDGQFRVQAEWEFP